MDFRVARFFERIAKTYRREKWGTMLRPLLETWKACSKQLDDLDTTVRLLVELLAYGDGTSHLVPLLSLYKSLIFLIL
jgi:hypothetical protein